MAIFHCGVKTHSRTGGRSIACRMAYRSGEAVADRDGVKQFPHRNSADVLYSNLCNWAGTRQELANEIEACECRKDARLAREAIVALPKELTDQARADLADGIAREIAGRWNVAVDVAVHRPPHQGENHHAHILWTTRAVTADRRELGKKTRILDDARTSGPEVEWLRVQVEALTNEALAAHNVASRVDRRSLEAQGEERDSPIRLSEAEFYSFQRGKPLSKRTTREYVPAVRARDELKRKRPRWLRPIWLRAYLGRVRSRRSKRALLRARRSIMRIKAVSRPIWARQQAREQAEREQAETRARTEQKRIEAERLEVARLAARRAALIAEERLRPPEVKRDPPRRGRGL